MTFVKKSEKKTGRVSNQEVVVANELLTGVSQSEACD